MRSAGTGFQRRTVLRSFAWIAPFAVLGASLLALPASAAKASKTAPVKIAVFAFELDDQSPAAALLNEGTSTTAAMDKVNTDARAELTQSGRYDVIDASKS